MMKEAILVIDTGSSSMRGVLYDNRGQMVAHHQIGYQMRVNGEMATQPIGDFTTALLAICSSITEQCRSYYRILAIALTSQRSSVVPVQAEGKPLDDVMMWYDKRSVSICREINSRHGVQLRAICGTQATPVLSAPKMCWYKRERPDVYQQTYKFMGIHDYLLFLLTGRFVTDVTLASRTNLLDIARGNWSPVAMGYYGLTSDKLCDIVPVGSIVGGISDTFAVQTGLPLSTQVISCGGDQQSSAIGAGLLDSGCIAVTAGSGGYAVRLIDSLQDVQNHVVACSVAAHPNRWMAEASCMAVGTAYNRICQLSMGNDASTQELDKALLQTAAGAHGIVMAAKFDGQEMVAENWKECCCRAKAENADSIRAAFEAMVAAVADCCTLLRQMGAPAKSIVIAGGLSNFWLFNQTLADMMNTPVRLLSIKETTCFGAWAQAAVALGVYPSLKDAVGERAKPTEQFEPNILHHQIYARQSRFRNKLYEKMNLSGEDILLIRRWNNMKKYTIGLYEKAMPQACSWQEKLIFAKATGFDFVEMSIDETDEKLARLEMTEEERQSLVQEFDRTGISVRSICLSAHRKYPLGSSDPQLAARSIGILCQAVQLADDLGVRIIQLAGYDVYYEDSTPETRQRFLENLRQIVQIAASKSVILGFETMETAFMNTVEKSMQYVEALASPYLGVYPDIGNLTNAAALYGTDVQCDMRLGKGSIVAMHLKETLPGVFREVPFGSGHVQFADALQTAWSLGVRRFVIEMWDVGKDSWQQDIRQAFTQVDGLLQQVGNKGQENEYEQHL